VLGVNFYMSRRVKEFVGESDRLKSVMLTDNVSLKADLCVVAVGERSTSCV
jgi:uncharacterized FAD-dependent dehydrogenase